MTSQAPLDGSGREAFGRSLRLKRRPDFVSVQEKGRRHTGRHYTLLSLPREAPGEGPARLGVTVSKKVGNAVVRNRVKRWVRESYRRAQALAPGRLDLVVIARPSAATVGFAATSAELLTLLRRLGGR